ncbi:MAG TPA: acetyl-CoA hydrolase/transferase C-terminal domain-containing protein [Steroidobacteraceae bacterium]|jgi:acyl-CoA hydrolase|nr:acetyl-CoA hydrolase/transferase C-terminal domain-containing protein [Steroidobacteraceae bacterium]
MPEVFADVGTCVDAVLRRVGARVVLALPLGIGKPNPLANEFYRRALRDPAIELTIITALSLLKPQARSALERRLLDPITARVFGSYVEPDYARAVRQDALPPNIRIIEFFLTPGAFLAAPHAQRNYLSANYTHVAREVLARGVNVIAQLVARRVSGKETQLSLGSNADVTADLLPLIDAARRAGRDIVMVGETHAQMPFMTGHAIVAAERFDFLVDHRRYDYDLFCPPNPPLSSVDHAIGMYASSLARDGGTLQIGIGEMGDALVYALLLRHQQNAAWRVALQALGADSCAALMDAHGGDAPFKAGLYACTEMFVDQLLELYRVGVLRRRVYDSLAIEKLLAAGELNERFDARVLQQLCAAGMGPRLTATDFAQLQRYGVFRDDVEFDAGRVRAGGGSWITADLGHAASQARMAAECLGSALRNGQVLHAGFFLGPRGFYAALRELSESDRAQFGMRGVAYVNQLYGTDLELRVLQRRGARFYNTTMMVTLLGAAVSDALESGQVVSGVGGQYNFVAMAHALPDARSVLCLRATRSAHGRTTSNIRWSYGHETIPRHLRDIVITEYGVADLRGRTDEEVIAALLNVTDSRFQGELLSRAQAAGKIGADYRIPDAYRANLPQRLERSLTPHRAAGRFSEYPFGTDLTAVEIELARALKFLAEHTGSRAARLRTALTALMRGGHSPGQAAALQRMDLAQPRTAGGWLERRLVAYALAASTAGKWPAGG